MPLSWGAKRKLSVFAVFAVIVFFGVIAIIYFFQAPPTCFDRKQNQGEAGVDCGEPCAPCSNQIRDLALLWTRFFPVSADAVEIAALLENTNQFLAAKNLVYAVKLYDTDNVLIAVRENTTFIEAGSRFVIYESAMATGNRTPAKAIVEIRSAEWVAQEPRVLKIDILNIDNFLDGEAPHVELGIKNRGGETYKNIEVTAVLFNSADEAVGASRTVADSLGIDEEKKLVFTWPEAIPSAQNVEIFFRQMP